MFGCLIGERFTCAIFTWTSCLWGIPLGSSEEDCMSHALSQFSKVPDTSIANVYVAVFYCTGTLRQSRRRECVLKLQNHPSHFVGYRLGHTKLIIRFPFQAF